MALTKTHKTMLPVASQATAEAGSCLETLLTPGRAVQLIAALMASQAEAQAGVATGKLMNPARVAETVAALPYIGFSAVEGSGSCIYWENITPSVSMETSNAIRTAANVSARQTGFVKTFDADGFTITWTKFNSPTGTNTIYYLAVG